MTTTNEQSSREQEREAFEAWCSRRYPGAGCSVSDDTMCAALFDAWLARSALSGSAESGEAMDTRCPDCLGAEFPGWKRGIRCKTCNGTASVEPAPTPTTPDQGDERRAFQRWEAYAKRAGFLDSNGNAYDGQQKQAQTSWFTWQACEKERDAAQPVAQEAEDTNNSLYSVLAECRDAFPMPERGSDLESLWAQAMGDPYSVSDYIIAAVASLSTPSALPAQAVGEKVTDEQIVATAREKQKRLAHWDYDDLVSFARAILALAAPMPQPEPTSKGDDDVAYRYACTLAQAIFDSEYASDPDYASGRVKWGLCDTTAGVLTQIDNMVSGMTRKSSSQQRGPQEASKLAATEIDLPTDHDVLEHCDQNGTTLAEAAFALAKPSKEAGKLELVAHIDSAKIEALKDTAYVDAVLSTRALPFTVPVYLRPTQQALSDEDLDLLWLEHRPPGVSNEEQYRCARKFARAILAAAGGSEK